MAESVQRPAAGLTLDDKLAIYKAAIMDQPCPFDSPEAHEIYAAEKKGVAEAVARGQVPHIPNEWPDL